LDDPKIPNLRLTYVGKRQILGPEFVGEIKLRAPFRLPPNVQYVARALDMRTGQSVTNSGTLGLGTTRPYAARPLVIILGLVVLLGIVGGTLLLYRLRRRQHRD
jgi:hypothetical protein